MPFPRDHKYTAEEFFALIPEDDGQMYELYNGEIVDLASPSLNHQDIIGGLYYKIRQYISENKGDCKVVLSPFDVVLNEDNVVIPDLSIICDPSKLSDGKRCNGAPDFIIEVTSGNRSNDFTKKLSLYQEYGVHEYWIVDPAYNRVVVYFFDESFSPNIYTFDQNIPVSIYQKNKIKLEINIAELLA